MPASAATETDKATAKELQRLRRLPENRVCPNCQKEADTLGFGAVCVAFKTFVCSDCKSAHQSFSHRCKSVQMSVWLMDEVKALDERNGGGNAACRRRYLAKLAEGDLRPKEDSTLDAKKKFVERAYELKRWMGSEQEEAQEAVPEEPASPAATEPGPDEHKHSSGRRSRKSSRKPGERKEHREHRHHRRNRSQSEPSPTEASWTGAGSSDAFGEAFGGWSGGGPSPYSHSEPAWGASPEASPSWERQSVNSQPAQRMDDPSQRPHAYSDSWALPGGSPCGSPDQFLARRSGAWGMGSPAASSAASRPQASVPQTPVLPHRRSMVPQTPILPPGRPAPAPASPVASPAAALAVSSLAALNPTNPWALDVMRLCSGPGGSGGGRPNGYAVSNHERSPPWSPATMMVY